MKDHADGTPCPGTGELDQLLTILVQWANHARKYHAPDNNDNLIAISKGMLYSLITSETFPLLIVLTAQELEEKGIEVVLW